ncbi:MAG: hypothetical protein U5K37_10675 [Natrialbaceae archaeon]|nr:hypothetical protein [Natrialbaceae archaeon]
MGPLAVRGGMVEDAQAAAGTAEGQGPVEISPDLARHLENKREELFEKFEIPDAFPPAVLEEAEERTEEVAADISAALEERTDLRDDRPGPPIRSMPRTSTMRCRSSDWTMATGSGSTLPT